MAEGIVHDTESKMEEFKDQLPADEVKYQPSKGLSTPNCATANQTSTFVLRPLAVRQAEGGDCKGP